MRLRVFSVLLLTFSILLAGTTAGLMESSVYKEKGELENPLNGEYDSSTTTPFSIRDSSTKFWRSERSIFATNERLPFIPHSHSDSVGRDDSIYTFNFSAREGDKLHMKVSVTREVPVQVVLMPIQELSEYFQNRSFAEVEKISRASKVHTRHFEAHVTIPEDGEYSLVIRFYSGDGTFGPTTTDFEVIIGRGLFSSIVVRTGGYIELFFISSFLVIVSGTGFYLYKKRKKKSSPERWPEKTRKKDIKIAEKNESSNSKDPPFEEEPEKSPNDNEFLRYGD